MKTKVFYFIISCLIISSLLILSGVHAQMQSSQPSVKNDSKKTDKLPNQKESFITNFDELLEKAKQNKSVRVIIGLDVAFQPEGEISEIQQKDQQTRIKNAQNDLLANLTGYKTTGVKQFDFIPYLAMEVDSALLEKIKTLPMVISIYEDQLSQISLAQSVPIVGATGGIANGYSGSGQTIAILDTGVSRGHAYFLDKKGDKTKVISEACYSTTSGERGEPNYSRSTCPDAVPEWTEPGAGLPCNYPQIDDCSHGTHVAGIASGKDVAAGDFGVAKESSLIAIKVVSSYSHPSDCNGMKECVKSFTSDQIKGLERVYSLRNSYNIASVNLSLGRPGVSFNSNCDDENPFFKSAVDNLRSANIATIIAAGNDGFTTGISFPACISTAISVGSTSDGGGDKTVNNVSNFSNSSDFLNLLAPGQEITSAIPSNTEPYNTEETQSGTSQAAPHVAGAWAILKEQSPSATVSQILTALASTGRIITDTREGANDRKIPRIRIDSASQQLAGTNCVRTPIPAQLFINGTLDSSDCAAEIGVNRDLYSFQGTAGASVAISISSTEFDSYLYLLDPNGRIIAFDDNGGGGTNSRIPSSGSFTLPLTGDYTILVTKADSFIAPKLQQNGNYIINILVPTAANAQISGRVSTTNGRGIGNISLVISGGNLTAPKIARTNNFGYYRFQDLEVGQTYIVSIAAKQYTFSNPTRLITLNEDLTGEDFVSDENN